MPRWLHPSGRSEYYLLNSNCQHFVLDFGLGIEIDFDAAALSRVWINSRVPQLVAGPTLGILAIYFSHLASKIGLQEHILECSMLHHRRPLCRGSSPAGRPRPSRVATAAIQGSEQRNGKQRVALIDVDDQRNAMAI